ncbi:hypothetical protein [Ruminococcus sp.]|uniref:hypothetical protein n=1 Tax=Ruminococcus sp. TaxID=41978 RepID=UPI0025ED8561|nr:hypothetical protein [Ruminococcus sp.]
MFNTIRCKNEYKRLCYPLSAKEYAELENELLNSDIPVTIHTWSGVILYEYEKYEICTRNNIPMVQIRNYLKNTEESLLWLCKHELQRSDIPPTMRRYLLGKCVLFEKMLGEHHAAVDNLTANRILKEPKYATKLVSAAEHIAAEYNARCNVILKYARYARGIDLIYDIDCDLALNIIWNKTKISMNAVLDLLKLSSDEVNDIIRLLSDIKQPVKHDESDISEQTSKQVLSIKDMPPYDPDAEISSLALTIPSWISSMERVSNVTDMSKVSDKARKKLADKLSSLCCQAYSLLDILKE